MIPLAEREAGTCGDWLLVVGGHAPRKGWSLRAPPHDPLTRRLLRMLFAGAPVVAASRTNASLRPRPGPQHYTPPLPLRLVSLAAPGRGSAAIGFLPLPPPPGPLRSTCDVTYSTVCRLEARVHDA
ncbi:hypothetical protein E2C01_010726 [Portunus trituberculatus]|uniref:Uncharacterized protein n=1 Tax=Portunus trituberculatus TaxID=210409 RepID=A0A5B7D963_PORTR|nr:hypothetical protein [Portunus trituberculatus]